MLVTPNFLFADARELVSATAPELSRPLRRLLQPDVAATAFSVSLQDPDRVSWRQCFHRVAASVRRR